MKPCVQRFQQCCCVKSNLLKRGMCLITFLAVTHLLVMLYYKNWHYTLKLADLLVFNDTVPLLLWDFKIWKVRRKTFFLWTRDSTWSMVLWLCRGAHAQMGCVCVCYHMHKPRLVRNGWPAVLDGFVSVVTHPKHYGWMGKGGNECWYACHPSVLKLAWTWRSCWLASVHNHVYNLYGQNGVANGASTNSNCSRVMAKARMLSVWGDHATVSVATQWIQPLPLTWCQPQDTV